MNVRLQYTALFTAGIYWNGQMLMNNYIAKFYMLTNTTDSETQNIAYERLKYFIYTELNSTIFVNREHQDQCQKFIKAGLKVTTLPSEPVDQLIGIMLYCKLNAIMEEYMIVHEVEVSSDLGDSMAYLHAADENLGPFDTIGWWHDSDLVHSDIKPVDSDKVVAMNVNSAWRELGLHWPEIDSTAPADNTVVFAEFKPNESK